MKTYRFAEVRANGVLAHFTCGYLPVDNEYSEYMKFANFIVEKIRYLPGVEIVIDDNFFQPLSPNQLFEIHDRIFKETSLGIYGGAFFKHRSYFVDQNLLDGDDMEQIVICAAGAFVSMEKQNFSAEFLEAASGTNASELFEIVARDDNTNFLL
ncbi:hypothetical protein EON80_26810, partial [bacterium]